MFLCLPVINANPLASDNALMLNQEKWLFRKKFIYLFIFSKVPKLHFGILPNTALLQECQIQTDSGETDNSTATFTTQLHCFSREAFKQNCTMENIILHRKLKLYSEPKSPFTAVSLPHCNQHLESVESPL